MSNWTAPGCAAAIARIRAGEAGLMVLQDDRVVFSSTGSGIRAALQLHDEQPELLRGACIVDRIIGRAAAMVFADGGAAAIYGDVMSCGARDDLEAAGIDWQAGELVQTIINRQGTGMCPMEQTILEITNLQTGLQALRQTVQRLMSGAWDKGGTP